MYLLQGAEGWISTREIEPAVGGAEGGQVSQSQVLRQQQTLGQTGLLALTQQLRHLRVQTQFCGARRGESKRVKDPVERLRVRTHTHTGVTGRLIFSETVSASREMSAASSRLQLIYSEFCSYHQNIIIVVIIIISDNNHHIHRHVFRLASWKHESGMKLLFGNVSSNRE